jgi:integrase/recombinase XerC
LERLLHIVGRRGGGAAKPDESGPEAQAPGDGARSIRHENPAEILLRTAGTSDPGAKVSKRWPERGVALLAAFSVTGTRLAEAIALNLDGVMGPVGARRLQVTGKGTKYRTIPVEEALEALLD